MFEITSYESISAEWSAFYTNTNSTDVKMDPMNIGAMWLYVH